MNIAIIGGGIAGCHAAINAAKRGSKVIVLEKAATVHSGCSGAGVDHWGAAYGNPACTNDLERAAESSARRRPYVNGMLSYITMKESYDALLDCEKMGLNFRDEFDEFAGSPMRDEESKILFAYNAIHGHGSSAQIKHNEFAKNGVGISFKMEEETQDAPWFGKKSNMEIIDNRFIKNKGGIGLWRLHP